MGTSKASNTDYNYNFKGETDIINFAKELGRKLKDGTLTVGDVKTIQEEGLAGKKPIELDEVVVTGKAASKEAKLSQETVLESIGNLLPKNIKTKQEFDTWVQSERGGKVIADALKPGGPINNYIRSRGTKQESDKMLDDVLFRVYNFNPEAKRKDGSIVGPEAFGEKIFADTAWAKVTARTKLFEEGEKKMIPPSN
jgi:hypothetical protein